MDVIDYYIRFGVEIRFQRGVNIGVGRVGEGEGVIGGRGWGLGWGSEVI